MTMKYRSIKVEVQQKSDAAAEVVKGLVVVIREPSLGRHTSLCVSIARIYAANGYRQS